MQQPGKPSASTPSTPKDVYKWASGRRRYNKQRQQQAKHRRLWIAAYHLPLVMQRGGQMALARQFGVHRSTVHRAVWQLWREWRQQREHGQHR